MDRRDPEGQQDQDHEQYEEDLQEYYLDSNEVQEEFSIPPLQGEQDIEMEENDFEPGAEDIQQHVEFNDDSIQGFFDHKSPVFSVAMSPANAAFVATGGEDDKSFLWSLESGEKICDLGVHTDSSIAVAFSSDGTFIASGGMDGKLFIYNCQGKLINSLEGPSEITWVEWHPRGQVIIAASNDGTLWMWQIPSGTCMNVFTGHSESITCGQWTPDGKAIVSGSSDGSIIVWDPKTGAAAHKWTQQDARFHQAPITSLSVSSDSTIIISGDQEGKILILQIATTKIVGNLTVHQESVEAIRFAPYLPYIATGAVDGNVHVTDLHTSRLRFTVEHSDAVTQVRWNPVSGNLITASMNGDINIWDGRTGELLKTLKGHQAGILDFGLRKDGLVIVTGSDDGTCLVFPVA